MATMAPVPVGNREDPEKDTDVESLETPQFVVTQSSGGSESDEEDLGYQGYQLLPQDPDNITVGYQNMDNGDNDIDTENPTNGNAAEPMSSQIDAVIMSSLDQEDLSVSAAGDATGLEGATGTIDPETEERSELWNVPRSTQNLEITQDQADKVRAAMSGFSLPTSSQPDWAKLIPEDQWKTQLIAKLKGQCTPKNDQTKKDSS